MVFRIGGKKIDSTGGLLTRSVIGLYSLLAMGDLGLNVIYCDYWRK